MPITFLKFGIRITLFGSAFSGFVKQSHGEKKRGGWGGKCDMSKTVQHVS